MSRGIENCQWNFLFITKDKSVLFQHLMIGLFVSFVVVNHVMPRFLDQQRLTSIGVTIVYLLEIKLLNFCKSVFFRFILPS